MERKIQTSTLRIMNNMINIQKAITIALMVFGVISLMSGIVEQRWYLIFIGIAEIIIGSILSGEGELE